jgi:hypothetical protein
MGVMRIGPAVSATIEYTLAPSGAAEAVADGAAGAAAEVAGAAAEEELLADGAGLEDPWHATRRRGERATSEALDRIDPEKSQSLQCVKPQHERGWVRFERSWARAHYDVAPFDELLPSR